MKTGFTGIAIVCIALGAAGCTRTANIYNVKEATVSNANGKALAKAQVRAAIITAGTSMGWAIVDAGPGKLEGTLRLRTHTAVVEIPYSERAYSVIYKSSENLQASGDTIHNNYNGWVQNLDRAIRTEIARI